MNMIMPHSPMVSEQSSAYTVLVVEDDMMVRMPIAEYLRDCGYTVLEAGDAAEAIATVHDAGPVNLVFSDVRMPGSMDGFGLARWLRTHYPDLPILLTSGYNSSRSLSVDVAQGVKLIEKPYSQAQVARRIQALLEA
jgi:CheY-like chemotaxis protein